MRKMMVFGVAVIVMALLASSALAAPQNFGGNATSTQHRNDNSGTGNFGQCHQLGAVQGKQSSTFNPSSQNTGEADCRQAGGRYGTATANCGAPLEPAADTQLTFGQNPSTATQASCT